MLITKSEISLEQNIFFLNFKTTFYWSLLTVKFWLLYDYFIVLLGAPCIWLYGTTKKSLK